MPEEFHSITMCGTSDLGSGAEIVSLGGETWIVKKSKKMKVMSKLSVMLLKLVN